MAKRIFAQHRSWHQEGVFSEREIYHRIMGRYPPENKYSEREWPIGPIKAKREALRLHSET